MGDPFIDNGMMMLSNMTFLAGERQFAGLFKIG